MNIIDIRNSEILLRKDYNKKNNFSFYYNIVCKYMNLSLTLDNIKYIIRYKYEYNIKINCINQLSKIFDEYFNCPNNEIMFNNDLFILEKSKLQKKDIENFFDNW